MSLPYYWYIHVMAYTCAILYTVHVHACGLHAWFSTHGFNIGVRTLSCIVLCICVHAVGLDLELGFPVLA